jgi:hypothetical protein
MVLGPQAPAESASDIGITRSIGSAASFRNSVSASTVSLPAALAAASQPPSTPSVAKRTLMPAFDPRDQSGQRYMVAPDLGDSSLRVRLRFFLWLFVWLGFL